MSIESTQSGTELAQSGTDRIRRRGKDHLDYWKAKVTKRAFSWQGKLTEISDWQIRISYRGRREWFNLQTTNKADAAAKARDIYQSLVGAGWEPTLAKFKVGMVVANDVATVGAFLTEVKAVSHLRAVTFEIYAKKFRRLVAGVFKVHGTKEKFDYVNGGYKLWLERINRIRLNKLNAQRIQTWAVQYLKDARDNPLQHKAASVTVHSLIRNSKSLFAKDITKFLTVKLPSPLPFDGVDTPRLGRSRYKSKVNPHLLLLQARQELSDKQPELYKIVLLALCAGLRRDEIDTLTWKQISWERNCIAIETTEHTAAKSHDSENEVDIDPELTGILKSFFAQSQSEFVINSPVNPRPNSHTHTIIIAVIANLRR